jgi:hypothetical protein
MGSSVFDNTTRWTPSFSVGNHLEMSQKSAAMLEFFIFLNAMEFYFLSVKNSVSNGPTDVQFILSVSPFEMWKYCSEGNSVCLPRHHQFDLFSSIIFRNIFFWRLYADSLRGSFCSLLFTG